MATTVHIPSPLLKSLDRRAKALGVSRNSLIVQAIAKEMGESRGWPAGFFESLAHVDTEARDALDETMEAVRKQRRSKGAVDL